MQSCYLTCVHSGHVGVAFLVSRIGIVRTVSVVGLSFFLACVTMLDWFRPLDVGSSIC